MTTRFSSTDQECQLTLFDLSTVQPAFQPIYDPAWDLPFPEVPDNQYESVGGQVAGDTSAYESVGGQVQTDTQKVAPQQCHWLEKYWVERHTKKYYYWRYCWMEKRKIKRCYIGSVNCNSAKRKYADIVWAIADGQLPHEIKQMIGGWSVRS